MMRGRCGRVARARLLHRCVALTHPRAAAEKRSIKEECTCTASPAFPPSALQAPPRCMQPLMQATSGVKQARACSGRCPGCWQQHTHEPSRPCLRTAGSCSQHPHPAHLWRRKLAHAQHGALPADLIAARDALELRVAAICGSGGSGGSGGGSGGSGG